MKTEAPNDLSPKYNVNFNLRGSLSRAMNPPLVVSMPRLVIFGDSSAIYLAQVSDVTGSPYPRLSCIKAQIYIHGWAVQPRDWSGVDADDTVKLYVVDGFELSAWDLVEGKKLRARNLVRDADLAIARPALDNLQTATQKVEWATLLEQAEDEWVKLTAERSAAEPGSDERERLDLLAADYLRVLRALREMTGNTAGSAASQTLVAELKKNLAEARKTAAPYLFSAPLVRPGTEQLNKIIVMQGNGTLHRTDSWLDNLNSRKMKDSAEPQVVLLNDRFASREWLSYISNSTLYLHDPKTLEEKSHWSPTPAPPAGARHALSTGNDQFWWTTDTGVFALKPNASGVVQLAWKTGAPWAIKQVGRYPLPQTPYNPPVNPNDLFDTMNVKAWLAKRSDPNAPLNDGMLAQLLLSDETGKYTTPPEGKSHILALPAGGETTTKWTNIRPHPTKPLVLVSDSRGVSTQCRYP
ncbi:MAG TPA: hypothetical protein VFY60_17105, partial [Pyrinomonadaceae bacterium]|nr:hypothetical protein [Pyrinomonadaceae bacterium]